MARERTQDGSIDHPLLVVYDSNHNPTHVARVIADTAARKCREFIVCPDRGRSAAVTARTESHCEKRYENTNFPRTSFARKSY